LFSKEHAPKTIKIYANRLNIGFDETDSIEETQIINLSKTDYEKNDVIPLRFVKFQNITNIAVSLFKRLFNLYVFLSYLTRILLLVICKG
jgi:hypothetical protein